MTKKAFTQSGLNIQSSNLNHFLRVYNRRTGRELGYIGNVSRNGLMLITRWRMETGSVFNMRIALPEAWMNQRFIDFDARCQWCRPDVDGESFDSGYLITQSSVHYDELIEALNSFFSFYSLQEK